MIKVDMCLNCYFVQIKGHNFCLSCGTEVKKKYVIESKTDFDCKKLREKMDENLNKLHCRCVMPKHLYDGLGKKYSPTDFAQEYHAVFCDGATPDGDKTAYSIFVPLVEPAKNDPEELKKMIKMLFPPRMGKTAHAMEIMKKQLRDDPDARIVMVKNNIPQTITLSPDGLTINTNGEQEMPKNKKPTPEVKPRKLTPKQMTKKLIQLESDLKKAEEKISDHLFSISIKESSILRLEESLAKQKDLVIKWEQEAGRKTKIINKMFKDFVEISSHFDFNKMHGYTEIKVGEYFTKTENTDKVTDQISQDRKFGRIEGAVQAIYSKWTDFRRDGRF